MLDILDMNSHTHILDVNSHTHSKTKPNTGTDWVHAFKSYMDIRWNEKK